MYVRFFEHGGMDRRDNATEMMKLISDALHATIQV